MAELTDVDGVVFHATIGPQGRVVVPSLIRKALGWEEGTVVTFALNGTELIVTDQRAALRRFRKYGRSLVPPGADVLEDFLEERRAVSRAENAD